MGGKKRCGLLPEKARNEALHLRSEKREETGMNVRGRHGVAGFEPRDDVIDLRQQGLRHRVGRNLCPHDICQVATGCGHQQESAVARRIARSRSHRNCPAFAVTQ